LLATLTLSPTRDTTLIEDESGLLSNGAGEHLFAGRTMQSEGQSIRRAMLLFDVSQIPPNATITSASLRLNMSKTISDAVPISLHRIQSEWGEGASDARGEEGKGIAAAPGDSTWIQRQFPSTNWNSPGGDFVAASSGTTNVAGVGPYTWSSSEMVTDITNWRNDLATNFGWMLIGGEGTEGTAKRFDSKENSTAANRPLLTIEYNEVTPLTLSIAGASIAEGNEGTTTLVLPVTISQAATETVTVKYKVNAGTAQVDTDFTPSEGTLTFASGDPLVKNVVIEVLGDRVTESDETLTVELSDATGATIETATATGTIQNDDAPPILTIEDISVTEGDEGTTAATLTVQLNHPSAFAITVDYATSDDTAIVDSDYQAATGTLNFAAGEVTKTITVTIVGDTEDEEDESLRVTLSNAANSQVTDDTASVTITDDDSPVNAPWRNAAFPEDVSGDGIVVPLDALLVINRLNGGGDGTLPQPSEENGPPPFVDVDGDNLLAPIDALLVINYLNDNRVVTEAVPQMPRTERPPVIHPRAVDQLSIAIALDDWWADDDDRRSPNR
jgi:hypothetical protein